MKKKTILRLALALVAIAFISFFVFQFVKSQSGKVTATVTQVIDKPNVAEDGVYSIFASDKKHTYHIDATGYLNTPIPPSDMGENCLEIPKVKEGQKLEFYLPQIDIHSARYADFDFDICFKKTDPLSAYYFFKVVN